MYVVALNGESQKWQWKLGYLRKKVYSGFMMTQMDLFNSMHLLLSGTVTF